MGDRRYAAAVGAVFALTVLGGPIALVAGSPKILPFSEFLYNLRVASVVDYVGRPGKAVQDNVAFEEMRQHLLTLYSGVSVERSLAQDDQVFDCIPIADQPGLRLQKGQTAKPPPGPPAGSPSRGKSGPTSVGEAGQAGAGPEGASPAEACETGTIPMRRLTLDELTRFATLKDYLAK